MEDGRNQRRPEVTGLVGTGLSSRMLSTPGLAGGGLTAHPMTGVVELPDPLAVREISDVETLRVVADQTRLAILRVLMTDGGASLPVMSAKELAAALTEPQTKLYRHLKQLEEAGFIQVAEVRLVSGIVEQRYRAGQLGIMMNPGMLADPSMQSAATESVIAVVNGFRDELIGNIRADRARMDSEKMILFESATRIPAEKFDELRDRLKAVMTEMQEPSTPGGVETHLFVAWYQADSAE